MSDGDSLLYDITGLARLLFYFISVSRYLRDAAGREEIGQLPGIPLLPQEVRSGVSGSQAKVVGRLGLLSVTQDAKWQRERESKLPSTLWRVVCVVRPKCEFQRAGLVLR